MPWQKIVGRVLTVAVNVALLIFTITGVIPTWWPMALAAVEMAASFILGGWKAPT